jgi:septum formation protein
MTKMKRAAVCMAANDAVAWRPAGAAKPWMRSLGAEFLDRFLDQAGRSVLCSVGCHHIKGLGVQFFERGEGDHFTIQGLPPPALLGCLRGEGLQAS